MEYGFFRRWMGVCLAGALLLGVTRAAHAESYDHIGGFGWETYFNSYPGTYGGYWGAHYGGPGGILSGAAPFYGNYGGWYSRHYVIGEAPWIAWDNSLNRSWDERYHPSPRWNYDGVSHLIFYPRYDVNVYIPESAGPITEAHNLHLEFQVRVPPDASVFLNGYETTSTGPVRRFVTEAVDPSGEEVPEGEQPSAEQPSAEQPSAEQPAGEQPGDGGQAASYPYEIRAVIVRNGRQIEQTHRVSARPGEPVNVNFDFGQYQRAR